jgi:SAM-dependent methyltransferase
VIDHEIHALLESQHPIPQAAAWQSLLGHWWREDPLRPGRGLALDQARTVGPWLLERLDHQTSEAHRAAAALVLICDAEHEAGVTQDTGVQACVRGAWPRLGALLAKVTVDTSAGSPLAKALAYLIARTSTGLEEATSVLNPILGADCRVCQAALAIADSGARPKLSRFVAAYLSAEIISTAFDESALHALRTLACPGCRAVFQVTATALVCTRCRHAFSFRGQVADLLPVDFRAEIEFTEEIADIYERESRPRFIRVMAADWAGMVTEAVERQYLQQQLHASDGMVVDVACGTGSRTEMVANQVGAKRVLALDVSLPMLQACLSRVSGIVPILGTATALPLASSSVAAVNCSDALQAFPDVKLALQEISRVLRPGGLLTGFTFVESASGPVRYAQHRFPAWSRRLFTADTLVRTVVGTGLTVTNLRQLGQGVFFTAKRAGEFSGGTTE